MPSSKLQLSVVVLCYQTGQQAVDVLEEIGSTLTHSGIDYELIAVANYWPERDDDTPEILRTFAKEWSGDHPVNVVAEKKKGGMGWDFKSGLDACRGEICAVIDGDGQYPSSSIVSAYRKMKAESLDICKTYRSSRADSFFRHMTSSGFNTLFSILFPGVDARDINSKPKLILKSHLKDLDLQSDDWFIDAEIMIKAKRLNLSVGEISIQYSEGVRESFVKPTAILEFVKNLIKWRFKK